MEEPNVKFETENSTPKRKMPKIVKVIGTTAYFGSAAFLDGYYSGTHRAKSDQKEKINSETNELARLERSAAVGNKVESVEHYFYSTRHSFLEKKTEKPFGCLLQ